MYTYLKGRNTGVYFFVATLLFRASTSCSKILNNKKYTFNTVNSAHPLCFRARASCSKILNVKSVFNTMKNSRATLFSGQAQVTQNSSIIKNIFNTAKIFRASTSCSYFLNVKSIFHTAKNFWATLFFRASARCSEILNDRKCMFNTVKDIRAPSVFQHKRMQIPQKS